MRFFTLLSLVAGVFYSNSSFAQAQFAAPMSYPFNADSYRALTYDLNRDSKPDVIIAGGGANKAAVLLSTATGTLGSATYYPTVGACGGVALGRVDCDNYADLLLADFGLSNGAGSVQVLPGQAGGTFGPAATITANGHPQHVAALDLNGDNFADLLTLDKASGTLSSQLHTGSCSAVGYSTSTNYATASGAFSAERLQLLDLNHDNYQDVLVLNQANPSGQGLSYLLGAPGGTFGTAATLSTGTGIPADVQLGYLNSDSYPDLVLINGNTVGVMLSQASSPYIQALTTYPLPANALAVTVADVTGDYQDDVVALLNDGSVVVLAGQNGGTLGAAATVKVATVSSNAQLLAADFNGDYKTDLAVVSSGAVQVLLNTTGTLPVQLVSFTARRVAAAAVLTWATATETRNAGFTVERSADGQTWQAVKQVVGHGTSSQAHTYSYSEPTDAGAVYYRLAQRDTDGTTTYSPVRALPAVDAPVVLYPNPSAGTFSIGDGGHDVRVRDALGRAAAATLGPDGQVQLAQPLPGLYFVEWLAAGDVPRRAKVVVR